MFNRAEKLHSHCMPAIMAGLLAANLASAPPIRAIDHFTDPNTYLHPSPQHAQTVGSAALHCAQIHPDVWTDVAVGEIGPVHCDGKVAEAEIEHHSPHAVVKLASFAKPCVLVARFIDISHPHTPNDYEATCPTIGVGPTVTA